MQIPATRHLTGMKTCIIMLLVLIGFWGRGQNNKQLLFNDTSLFFIKQADHVNAIELTTEDLALAGEMLVMAVQEHANKLQQYFDSTTLKHHRKREQVEVIDVNQYFFKLIPDRNDKNEILLRISGDCKDLFKLGNNRHSIFDQNWKRNFIDGNAVMDGGSCFIYLDLNLTQRTHGSLLMNRQG